MRLDLSQTFPNQRFSIHSWAATGSAERWRFSINPARENFATGPQKQLTVYQLLIIDELDYVPLSPTGAELLFEVFSQRYERGSVIVTSDVPSDEWIRCSAQSNRESCSIGSPIMCIFSS